ncbi:MAG: CPBP family intramembrane metalloprotease [Flavobacteriaceae bacterium]|nr:MAG: CPBP family intramembrane metalloprotease [Flavobacteriaceae bacterium]
MNFIQQAYKGQNDWWMYIVTLLAVFIATQMGSLPLGIVALFKVGGDMDRFQESTQHYFTDIGLNSNFYLFMMLLPFIFGLPVLILCIKKLHKKKITEVITSRKKIDWHRIFYGAGLWAVVSCVMITLGIIAFPDYFIWNFKPIPFLILVVVSILFIPLQTSFEEIIFRGYLMQGIGMLIKNNWVPLFLTAILFGLLHAANPEIEKIGYIALVFYIGTGFLFGIITLMDEGTELAMGMHAVNNIVAALFVTTDWTVFQTDALYIDISEPSAGWELFFPVLVVYPIIIIVFSKKYGWTNWKEKLFGKIENPIIIEE